MNRDIPYTGEELLKLRSEGKSWREIGLIYNRNHSTLWRFLNSYLQKQQETVKPLADPELIPTDYEWPEKVDWREYFGAWEQILELHQRADPYVEFFTLDLSHLREPVAIVSASDLHLGGGFTSHAAIKRTVEYILARSELHLGLSGDTIEGFLPGVKPAETVEQQVSSVKAQLWAMESLVDDLLESDKLRWMTWGDHDAKWFEQTIGLNVVREMVKHKVPYFTGRGLLRIKLAEQEYYVLVNHSERFKSQWSATHQARRGYEQFFPADVVITGHTHKPEFRMFFHYEFLREAGLNVGGKSWLVQNGTFKVGPDPYTIRSWSKGVIGVPTIVFHSERHDVDVLETPEKAVAFINGLRS